MHSEWLQPGWSLPGVGGVMTTRAGGVSTGPYASMNLGAAVDDDPAAVRANRERFAQAIGARPVWLKQVFTDKDYDLTIISHTEPADIGIYAPAGYYFQYDNPKFNDVIAELSKTVDQKKRLELLGEAQKILAHDVPAVYLFELPKIGVWDAKLQGMWANSPIQANDLTQVKWAD